MGKSSRSIQKDLGSCCLCIPIRIGVGICCLYTFVQGLVCILIVFSQDIRMLPGGYNPATRWFGVWLGQLGVIFGITGLMGVADNKPFWIRTYNYFQWAQLALSVIVFVMDMTTLNSCEAYSYNIHSQIAYNANIENVALKGLCGWTRTAYQLGYVIHFMFQFYVSYVGQCYYAVLMVNPAYLIKFSPSFEPVLSRESVGEPGMYMKFEALKTPPPPPEFQAALGAHGEELGYGGGGYGGGGYGGGGYGGGGYGYGSAGGSYGGRINLDPGAGGRL